MIETSFTMRGTTSVILQLQQILRLPLKMSLRIDPAHIWHVIYHARSNKRQPPPSQNIAPATQNEYHDWSISHMKRHLQRAVQQESASNFTNYCACHVTWIWWLIRLTYETSFTICRASKVTLPTHQVLHLPCKMNLSIDPPHIWNVIYNAREQQASSSNFTKYCACHAKMNLRTDPAHIWNVIYHAWSNSMHLPTSPNIAPATQNDTHGWSCSHMKRHLQCAEQQHSPSNLTKYCACHAKWHSKIWTKSTENGWSVMYNARPTMIRTWNCKTEPARSWSLRFSPGNAFHFCIENYNISRSGYLSKFHQILRLPRKVTVHDHQMLRLPRTVTLRHHQILCLPRKVAQQSPNAALATKSDIATSPSIVPATKSDRTVTFLNCCFTELLLYWAATLLLLYWAVTLLNCYFKELLLYGTVTWIKPLLYWTVTLLSCYLTELLLNCYFTELLLSWAVTLLNCYSTELLLD